MKTILLAGILGGGLLLAGCEATFLEGHRHSYNAHRTYNDGYYGGSVYRRAASRTYYHVYDDGRHDGDSRYGYYGDSRYYRYGDGRHDGDSRYYRYGDGRHDDGRTYYHPGDKKHRRSATLSVDIH